MAYPELPETLPENLRDKRPALLVVAMPADTNSRGDIFGGWLMSQMDLAGAVRAMELSRKDVATRFAETTFEKPIYVGERVSFYAEIVKIGRTSVTIDIQAWTKRRDTHSYEKVATGSYVYVAIDENKKAVPIQPDK